MTFRPAHRASLCVALLLPIAALTACASAGNPDDGMQLVVRDGHLRELGASCAGARPFLEFHKGAELALLDDDGLEVFTAVLDDGEAVKIDDIDYGRAPRIPTFCRFQLGEAALDDAETYSVSIDGHVVAEHRADDGATMIFVPALATVAPVAPTIEGTE